MVVRKHTITTRRITWEGQHADSMEKKLHVIRHTLQLSDIKAIEQRDANTNFGRLDKKPICLVYLYTGDHMYVLEEETLLVKKWEKFLQETRGTTPEPVKEPEKKLLQDVSEPGNSKG